MPLCQLSVGLAAVELELRCPRGPYQGRWVTQKNWGKTGKFVQLLLLLKACEGKVLFTSSHVTLLFIKAAFSSLYHLVLRAPYPKYPTAAFTSYVLPSRDF